jgi:hypothetical protein
MPRRPCSRRRARRATCPPSTRSPRTAPRTMTAVCIRVCINSVGSGQHDSGLVGAAGVLALMVSRVAGEALSVAGGLADGARTVLGAEGRGYTGLHVRCGGSVIPVGACNVSAGAYYDGLKGDVPRLLLRHMQGLRDRYSPPRPDRLALV